MALPEALSSVTMGYLLIFSRISGLIMTLPALGDEQIPARVRLLAAILFTIAFYPLVSSLLGDLPVTTSALGFRLMGEALIGIFLGLCVRMLMSAVHVAGTIIGFQTTLSAAMTFDPAQGAQTVITARFMGVVAVMLIFTAELHHVMIAGMAQSFQLFADAGALQPRDVAQAGVTLVSQSFALGVQLSAPFLVYGVIWNVGLGIMARLTPQIQVFFISQPLTILFMLALFMMVFGVMMTLFTERFGAGVRLVMGL